MSSNDTVKPQGRPRRRVQDEGDLRSEIALRAYEIWEASGREAGHDVDHWLAAEREVNADKPGRRRSPRSVAV